MSYQGMLFTRLIWLFLMGQTKKPRKIRRPIKDARRICLGGVAIRVIQNTYKAKAMNMPWITSLGVPVKCLVADSLSNSARSSSMF